MMKKGRDIPNDAIRGGLSVPTLVNGVGTWVKRRVEIMLVVF